MDKVKKALKWFFYSYIWVAILVFVFDISSKWIVQNYAVSHGVLEHGTLVTVIPNFFNITISHNLGAAFSIGDSGSIGWRIAWIAVSLIMSIGLSWYYAKQFKKITIIYKVALVLMIGGAVGNLIDRAFYWNSIVGFEGVIDWLDFEFGVLGHFATFNIADAALVIGVIILILGMIIDMIKESKEKAARGEYKYSPKELEEQEAKAKEVDLVSTETENKTNNEVNE